MYGFFTKMLKYIPAVSLDIDVVGSYVYKIPIQSYAS